MDVFQNVETKRQISSPQVKRASWQSLGLLGSTVNGIITFGREHSPTLPYNLNDPFFNLSFISSLMNDLYDLQDGALGKNCLGGISESNDIT